MSRILRSLTRSIGPIAVVALAAAGLIVACGEGTSTEGPSLNWGPNTSASASNVAAQNALTTLCTKGIQCAAQIQTRQPDRSSQELISSPNEALAACINAAKGAIEEYKIPDGILWAIISCIDGLPCSALSNPEVAQTAALNCAAAAGFTVPPTPPQTRRDQGADKFVLPDFSFPTRDSTVDAGFQDAASDADLGS